MSVTPIRHISGKLSGSRNASPGPYAGRSRDASSCHWCRNPFKPGQMRYPILDDTTGGWETVSICMSCFKEMEGSSHDPAAMQERHHSDMEAFYTRFKTLPRPKRREPVAPRQERPCPGCGEPIFVAPNLKWRLQICSARCYQRVYRKRKRETGSTIEWKCVGESPRNRKCASCKKYFRGKRKDALFCSNKCRQWHYRRRDQEPAP
jgi:hypothetical protein